MKKISSFWTLYLLMLSAAAVAQAPAGSNWTRVQQLPIHTKVHIKSDKKSRVCSIDSVDEQSLTCSGSLIATSRYTFNRGEIKSITLARHLRSTAIGAGIGAGAGVIAGAAIGGPCSGCFISLRRSETIPVLAAVFAVPGGIIGLGTDFAQGPTIYRRN